MRLTAKTDLEAPVSYVFDCLSDHQFWEKEAVARGADVEGSMDASDKGQDVGWVIRFPYRGRMVKLQLRLVEVLQNERLVFAFHSQQIEGDMVLSVISFFFAQL